MALVGGMLVMLTAPDLDFIPFLITGGRYDTPLLQHGGATHSLIFGVVAAVLFAALFGPMVRLSRLRLFSVGLLAWWSHIVIDFFTWRGGVTALWPITDQRFASPIPLFYGARHSEPLAIDLHLITLATELAFALVLCLIARKRTAAAAHAHKHTIFERQPAAVMSAKP